MATIFQLKIINTKNPLVCWRHYASQIVIYHFFELVTSSSNNKRESKTDRGKEKKITFFRKASKRNHRIRKKKWQYLIFFSCFCTLSECVEASWTYFIFQHIDLHSFDFMQKANDFARENFSVELQEGTE